MNIDVKTKLQSVSRHRKLFRPSINMTEANFMEVILLILLAFPNPVFLLSILKWPHTLSLPVKP